MAWINPKLDWVANPKNPKSEDMNRIEGNIDYLKTDIETKKGSIVSALNTVGINSDINDTYNQLANKITGAKKTGVALLPSNVDVAIPNGIYDIGGGVVQGDVDLISANIKPNVNIFGVVGNYQQVPFTTGDAKLVTMPISGYIPRTTERLFSTVTMNVGMSGVINFFAGFSVSDGGSQRVTIRITKNGTTIHTLQTGYLGVATLTADIPFVNGDALRFYGFYTGDSKTITVDTPMQLRINIANYIPLPTVVIN